MKPKISVPINFTVDATFPTLADGLGFFTEYGLGLRQSVLTGDAPPAIPPAPGFTPAPGQNYFHFQVSIVLPPRDLADMLTTMHNSVSGANHNRAANGSAKPLRVEIDKGHWGKWTVIEIDAKAQQRQAERDQWKVLEWGEDFRVPNREVLISALGDIANETTFQHIYLSHHLPESGPLHFTANLRCTRKDFPIRINQIIKGIREGSNGSTLGESGRWNLNTP